MSQTRISSDSSRIDHTPHNAPQERQDASNSVFNVANTQNNYEEQEQLSRLQSSKRFLTNLRISDVSNGIIYGLYYSKNHLFHSYVVIPVGILSLFTILYGLNQLLVKVIKIKFPASVLGMLINLVVLVVLNVFADFADHRKSNSSVWKNLSTGSSWILTNYLIIIKPSMNFTLKWINVFFIPSFIILPLSDHITFIECLKIAGVFVGGFLILLCIDVYAIMGLKWVLNYFGIFNDDTKMEATSSSDESLNGEVEEIELEDINSTITSTLVFTSMRDDITTIDISNLRPTRMEQEASSRSFSVNENPFNTENNSIETSTFRHLTPNSLPQPEPVFHRDHPIEGPSSRLASPRVKRGPENEGIISSEASTSSIGNEGTSINDTQREPAALESAQESFSPKLNDSSKKIVIFLTNYIDWILYSFLFLVSLPFYYVSAFHVFLPYHLGMTIISYYIALLIPQKWPSTKKFAHPILISTAMILFMCFIGSLIYHNGQPNGFLEDLRFYKTGKNYLNLFNDKILIDNGQEVTIPKDDRTATAKWPGCGDVLSSLMDISIVSLSLPMFTHRKDFVKNFWVLMPPIILSIALTFFIYPVFCINIGIQAERSIGFIGRSVTLALGTPLITSLGGSVSLMAVCTILSGICGVLVGDTLFAFLRVPKNDYVTRGVSLGINCGAIATAHLLNVDPRAASMSSLSFSVFGTVMVIMASVGSVRDLIRSWVGL
ncbi:LrgB-like family-domain-containing protein [Scheffersomyces xylosifermentans]|uniref:LrgB-like family-domain-containing protein n=1 Tax=Scheffersomyces xylosifermentans TaxID=1304137 RepID=UPI00315CC72D